MACGWFLKPRAVSVWPAANNMSQRRLPTRGTWSGLACLHRRIPHPLLLSLLWVVVWCGGGGGILACPAVVLVCLLVWCWWCACAVCFLLVRWLVLLSLLLSSYVFCSWLLSIGRQ